MCWRDSVCGPDSNDLRQHARRLYRLAFDQRRSHRIGAAAATHQSRCQQVRQLAQIPFVRASSGLLKYRDDAESAHAGRASFFMPPVREAT